MVRLSKKTVDIVIRGSGVRIHEIPASFFGDNHEEKIYPKEVSGANFEVCVFKMKGKLF